MKLIPCIICDNEIKSNTQTNVIAVVCDNCNNENITNVLKNLNKKKLEEIINKKLRLTKDGELI